MKWSMRIEGDDLDISEISKVAIAYDCSVERDADGISTLTGSRFEKIVDLREAVANAKDVLSKLNGLVRLDHFNHRPVRLTGSVSSVSETGKRSLAITIPSIEMRMRTGEVSMTVTRADGSVESRPSSESAALTRARLARSNVELEAILDALSGEITWQKLRFVFEKLNRVAGTSKNALIARGYATEQEVNRFKHNAQDPRLSGVDAVHGVPSGPVKSTKMTINEAHDFVCRMFAKCTGT